MTFSSEDSLPEGSSGVDAFSPDKRTLDAVFSMVYEELRRIASYIRRGDPSATLNSTALVDETYLKLRNSPELAALSDMHFKAIAAKAMRQVLVDAARRRNSQKRGGGAEIRFVTLDESASRVVTTGAEILALHSALNELAELNPRQAAMVECRFFTGLNVKETAAVMGVSESVVEREWRAAKAWLAVAIGRSGE